MKFTLHRHLSLASIALLSMAIVACSGKEEVDKKSLKNKEEVDVRPEVVFAKSDDQPLVFHVESQGIVQPRADVTVNTRSAGYVVKHALREGFKINKGDTLLMLNQQEAILRLRDAQAEFARTKVEYELEKNARSTASAEYLNQETDNSDEYLRSKTGFQRAELDLERAKLELSYTVLRAPITGYIRTDLNLSTGAFINSGLDLGRIIDFSTVLVRLEVLESELLQIKEGMQVELYSQDGTKFEGQVISLSPEVNKDQKTGQVLVEVPNPDRVLRAGMTVRGRIFIKSVQSKVRAPRAALLERDNRTLVFKLTGNVVNWVYITPEAKTSDWIVFDHAEIAPGDTLAVDRHFAVSHLQKVNVKVRQ